jgi:large subunit ribosomal protein L35
MPKKKAHKGLAKRVKVTKKGKIIGAKTGYHHKLVKRSARHKRQARELQITGRRRKNFIALLSS